MTQDGTPSPQPSRPPVQPPRWAFWAGLVGLVLSLPLALVLALRAPAGQAWVFAHVPGVRVVSPQGSIWQTFQAERIEVDLPRGGLARLDGVRWSGLALGWTPQAAWRVGVSLDTLRADKLLLRWVANPHGGGGAPQDVASPVAVHVGELAVGEALSPWWGMVPLHGLKATVAVQGNASLAQQVAGFNVQALPAAAAWHAVNVQALEGRAWHVQSQVLLGVDAGLPLQLRALGRSDGTVPSGLPLNLQASAQGRLADLQAQARASLDAQPMALQVQARLQPFAPWPLVEAQLQAQALDVRRFWPDGPSTQLHGSLTVSPQGANALNAQWSLDNGQAGPWSEGWLPIRRLVGKMVWPQARIQGVMQQQPWQAGELDVKLDGPDARPARNGDPARPAGGQWRCVGGWGGQRSLTLSWQDLWLPAWDERAPPVHGAQGELRLVPDWPAPGQGWAAPTGAWSLKGQAQVVTKATSAAMSLGGQGAWSWRDAATWLTVQRLRLDAAPAWAQLDDVRLTWGQERLDTLRGKLQLQQFDPAVWMPWPSGMAGHNALSGQGQVALNRRAEGTLQLHLAPSLLAGVPLQGNVAWQTAPGQAALTLQVDAGGNTVRGQASWPRVAGQAAWPHDPTGWAGTRAEWHVQAPDLATLHPLQPLLGLRQLKGEMALNGTLSGAWPDLTTQGDWQARALQVQAQTGPLVSIQKALGQWQWDGHHPHSVALVDADVTDADVLGWQVSHLVAQLHGQLHDHRISLQAQGSTPAGSKAWGRRPLTVAVAGQGAWQGKQGARDLADDLQSEVASWLGQLQQVSVTLGALPSAASSAEGAPVAAYAQPVSLVLSPTTARWQRDRLGSMWSVAATDLTLAGIDLHLDQAVWRQPAAHQLLSGDRLLVAATLLPINVSEQLQHWQPDAGWGGQLMLGGVFQVRQGADGDWHVQADVGRQSGDLTLREPTIQGSVAQPLGIRETRFQLLAEHGEWHFSQRFDGALLGRFEGDQLLRARSAADLPQPADALSGRLLLQAPNLRPWGTWMPAGWLLSGQAQAEATLGGSLGAPTYQGQVTGSRLALSNALMGVQLADGELDAHLAGDHVQLTRLEAHSAGHGVVRATGEARLAEGQASVQVHADRLAVLQRVDRKLALSGDVQLQLGQEEVGVDGALRVDEGLFDISRSDAPTVGDDVNVLRPTAHDDDETSSATPRKTRVRLDIDLGQQLRIQGRGLEATLTGKLKAGTAANKPTLNGTVAVEKGRYAAYGQKLVVEHSTVVFNGAVDNPRLDILAMRPQSGAATESDVKVGVSITGTAQDPRVRLYADPEMTETEKLSWLVLGRAPSGLGGADIGLLQTAAVALLSGEGKSTSDNLIGALGLDELSVRQNETASTRETVVNVGKQVSKFWYVGYERNLAATSGSWQLVYKLAQRFMVRLQAGEANALDFIWSWRWD